MPTHTIIHSEMGEKTNAEIKFVHTAGGKLYLMTELKLKGRGIKQHDKNTYFVTALAFEKLKKQHNTAFMAAL